jgi:hypothetical protein
MTQSFKRTVRILSSLVLASVIATACGTPAATATPADPNMNAALTQAVQTAYAGLTATAAPPTETPAPSPTPTSSAPRTPPTLPGMFETNALNPNDQPQSYLTDTCQYLKLKWDPNNAAPGTVVMVIMFHSITKGEVTEPNQISIPDLRKLMNDLHDMGFEAIDMQQLSDFMYNNAKIPQRSVLLVVDDRHYREYFDVAFRQYYEDWGWKVVNSWISAKDTPQQLWDENAQLEAEGWVDHQAHGVVHNIPMGPNSSDQYILGELQGSIDAIKQHFNKTPIAIIWPGGGFSKRPVELARQVGYKLGFTINPRGPLMFNWIPQSEQSDPMRPSYIPEGSAGDPLLTLPRYWDTDARSHLDTVRVVGKDAAAYAAQNKATELEYYDIMCAPTYGPIPTVTP